MVTANRIIKSKRKTISIVVNSVGEVIVKAPTTICDADIFKFLQEQQDWIISKQNKCLTANKRHENLLNFKEFLLLGVNYATIKQHGLKTAKFTPNGIVIPADLSQKEELHKVVVAYKKLATKWLKERTLAISRAIGLSFDEFKISDTKGRWGCCNSNFCINLNWRVICLPTNLIDYVIVHELSHLKEMNHSQKFWALVDYYCPNYKLIERWLKQNRALVEII